MNHKNAPSETVDSPSKGRLIIDSPTAGARNMAIDEYLLESVSETGTPTLRFYEWDEPTLSLGYFQKAVDRQSHLPSKSCTCVRRASGGGAILHHHELTYSYCLPIDDRLSAKASDIYDIFHATLIETLRHWGIAARLADARDVQQFGSEQFLCFERRSLGDVVIGNSKVAGSAQRRHKSGLLQHGSVLLRMSPHTPELAGIFELSNVQISVADLCDRWMLALKDRLAADFCERGTTKFDIQRILQIEKKKFGSQDWTCRR